MLETAVKDNCKSSKMRLTILMFFVSLTCMVYALPVQLDDFSVSELDGEAVLRWSTRLEIDNDFYQIERSTDGINFAPIATVSGSGTVTGVTTYDFTDASISSSTLYWYQIKQIDFDGSVNYFEIERLFTSAFTGGLDDDFTFFPTRPSRHGSVYIQGNDVSGARMSISLHSINGAEVFNKPMTTNNVSLSKYNLSPGMYVIAVSGEGFIQRERLLITE
ncbi:MAG: hypothetical protein ACI959_000914 [Limisphaerales bacterium]|jgi:hypothetical protein